MSELSGDNIDQQNNIPNHSNFVDEDKLLLICNKKSVDDSKCHKILNMTATTNTMKHTNNNATDLSKQNKHLVGKEQICFCLPERPIDRDDLKTTISIVITTSEDDDSNLIKNHTCSKNIDLPSIVTDPDLIEAQAQNKISESETKRDHLTQQLNNPISNTIIPEIEEYVIKNPNIENADSDMDISSDDESLKIIESPYSIPLSLINLPGEKVNDVFNPDSQSRELSYYRIPSVSKHIPEITTSSTPLKINNESCLTFDYSKAPLNVYSEQLVINDVILSYRDPRIIRTPNNESTPSIYDTNCQEDGLYLISGYANQYPVNKLETIDTDAEEIFRKLAELLETSSEYEKNVTKSQNQLILDQNQKNLQQLSVESNLSVPHNVEASSKSCMNVLCGNYGVPTKSNYVKNNSVGVQLGLSSNVNNTLTINKTSNELMETINSNTEDPNRKKFEISNIVIKLLSPYYGNNMFKTKELFKFMAREMVHKLLESVIHPDEQIIKIYIRNMFLDKQMIQVESEDQIVKLLKCIP